MESKTRHIVDLHSPEGHVYIHPYNQPHTGHPFAAANKLE